MRVLFVTSEAYPLIKTGGLADVSGSLPAALAKHHTDIKLLIPGYPAVLEKLVEAKTIGKIQVYADLLCELLTAKMPDSAVEVIVIKNPALYEREGGPYIDTHYRDWQDNPLRFGVLAKVAAQIASDSSIIGWLPDLIHCNDWQTGLCPYYLSRYNPNGVRTLFSIHNLAFQGNFHPDWMSRLELDPSHFIPQGFEFYGQLSFLKAGLFYADKLSTVSPNYAKEIQTDAFGFGLQGLLKTRAHDITGILNGIDLEEWNPENDPYLPYSFNTKTLNVKQKIKQSLQEKLHLKLESSMPLLGVVSRLTYQKGLDVLLDIMPDLINMGCQIVILGSGDKSFETRFQEYAKAHPDQVSATIGYNEALSHLIMAGADIFVMPSRFEPCGLNQLYGLRYGTPSIVNNTGGLADSICNATLQSVIANHATGFVMENVTKVSLLVTIQQAIQVWEDKIVWKKIQKNGMRQDVGWEHSAKAYLELYASILK